MRAASINNQEDEKELVESYTLTANRNKQMGIRNR